MNDEDVQRCSHRIEYPFALHVCFNFSLFTFQRFRNDGLDWTGLFFSSVVPLIALKVFYFMMHGYVKNGPPLQYFLASLLEIMHG